MDTVLARRSIALGARLVVDIHPAERELGDVVADPQFQVELREPKVTAGTAAVAPLGIVVVEAVPFDECSPDALPEDRAPVVASAIVGAAQRTPMRSEAIPQRGPASRRDGTCADTCEAWKVPVRSPFVGREKEGDAPVQPVHGAVAVFALLSGAHLRLETVEASIESVENLNPVRIPVRSRSRISPRLAANRAPP